jgi:Eukaryotic cytochrome b561
LAFVLVSNALLLLQPTHTPEQKRLGAVSHGILNSVALALFTTAVIIIIYNKGAHGAAHFTTAHGRIGLITYILLLIQVHLSYRVNVLM